MTRPDAVDSAHMVSHWLAHAFKGAQSIKCRFEVADKGHEMGPFHMKFSREGVLVTVADDGSSFKVKT